MAEVLRSFDDAIRDESGAYQARVVGRLAGDGMWEGWLEFVPLGSPGGQALVSPVESRQPERAYLVYWASGLTAVYAEGALRRARYPIAVRTRVVPLPASDAPAPPMVHLPPHPAGPEPILDPFAVGSRSLDILAQELGAIGRARLLNIVAAYDLNPNGADLQRFSDAQLIAFIVGAVDAELKQGSR